MDLYLPADFRELHGAAADDWRDLPSSCGPHDARDNGVTVVAEHRACEEPDPSWRVL